MGYAGIIAMSILSKLLLAAYTTTDYTLFQVIIDVIIFISAVNVWVGAHEQRDRS
jgi:hypothetical protein